MGLNKLLSQLTTKLETLQTFVHKELVFYRKFVYDYSDEFEILPDPTKGMHLKLSEPFQEKGLALIRNFKKWMLAEVKLPRPW